MVLDHKADDAIIVALGSNMAGEWGSPGEVIERAIQALDRHRITIVARSRQWGSAAWPDDTQPPYRNAVAIVDTAFGPISLLRALHAIELLFGRTRKGRNAPRVLDLDLIAHGRLVRSRDPILPHPRATERRFVMGPLAEILPTWRDPVSGRSAEALAGAASVARDAAPID